MNLEELVRRYLADKQPPPSVRAAIRTSWPKFLGYCQTLGLTQGAEITATVLEDFYKSLLWEPNEKGQFYKAHSVDQFVRRARQVLRWGADQGFLSQDPTLGLRLPRLPAAVPELLTKRQLRTLLRSPDCRTPMGLRDALLLQLLTETPLGLQRVLALTEETIRQLELEATTWTLLAAYLERARPILLRYGDDCEENTLFLTRDGKPMPLPTAAARLNEIMKQVGFGKRLPSRLLHKSHQATLQPLRERHSLLRQEGTNRGDTC